MKRKIAAYAVATATTGLMAAAVQRTYSRMGTTPEVIDEQKVKRAAVAASLLVGMVWLAAAL